MCFSMKTKALKKYTDLKISGSCPDTERCLWAVILLKANKMTQIELITKKTVYLHCFNQTQKKYERRKNWIPGRYAMGCLKRRTQNCQRNQVSHET